MMNFLYSCIAFCGVLGAALMGATLTTSIDMIKAEAELKGKGQVLIGLPPSVLGELAITEL